MKRSGTKSAKLIPRGYSTHTISSAIKADYGKQEVREKLSELNSTVESRVEDFTSKPLVNEKVSKKRIKGPFVVGKVKI
jgi:phosphoenolpyruvate carboxylase